MLVMNYIKCLVYLDDIIVFSKTIPEHFKRWFEVFERLREFNMKLKPSKCCFLKGEVFFLGHKVSDEEIAMENSTIETVLNLLVPTSTTEVRSFLRLCSYYRIFISWFAEIIAPLHALTARNQRFRWTDDCQIAFEWLKVALITVPVLAMPTDEDAFIHDIIASNCSIGAVLSLVRVLLRGGIRDARWSGEGNHLLVTNVIENQT